MAAGRSEFVLCNHQSLTLSLIHNVRNLDYRTETEFEPRWETRTYNLSELNSADIIAVYWAGKAIAHVMVSFGFAEEKITSAISIETRKEKGESYSYLAVLQTV